MDETSEPHLDKAALIDRLARHAGRLRALGIRRIGLFGSFARGEQRPDSDVDLLVEFEPGRKSFAGFMEAAFFLEELLGRRVELLTAESLSPHIGPRILQQVEYVPLAA